MRQLRRLVFVGRSYVDLTAFPASVQDDAGYQLQLVQEGREPLDWKPMKSIGAGVKEIRIRDKSGAFRVIYIAKIEDAVYVLHCFEKKSQRTGQADLALASSRYKSLVRDRTRR
jgi:phage-related protein